jgi:hypothetical protein
MKTLWVLCVVLTGVVIKSSVLWDILPYSAQSDACCLLHVGFCLGLLFNPEDGVDCSSEILTSNGLHNIS